MTSSFKKIELRMTTPVAEVILNMPDQLNAIDHDMHVEITEAFHLLRKADGVRCVLFSSTGKAFSAGGSFNLILDDHDHPERRSALFQNAKELFLSMAECHIPIVTALHGDAIGLGATLILTTDAIVAARSARIADPHVAIGLVAGDGGTVVWPQATGLLRAKRHLLTGDRLTAQDAYDMGLITDLVDGPDEVISSARTLAERIAALPPMAVQLTKKALNKIMRSRYDEVFEDALNYELDTMFSDDVVEAIAAFKERRSGNFKGS